jgi:Ca2+-binding EF-hand superfamily protein
MLKNMGFSMDKKSVEALFTEVDTDRSGFIEFDEYCAMMVKLTGVRKRINAREYIAKEDILAYRQAFQKFDSSGDGTVSSKELDALLRKMGLVLRFDQVEALMAKYDANQSGELDFTEFLSIMVDLKKLRRQRKINPATTTAKELRAEGFTAAEVKESGFPAKLMRQDGFRAQEMVDVFKTVDLRHSGYTAREMRQTDAGISKLKRVGYSSTSLRNAGYSSRSIAAINKRLNRSNEEVPHYSQRRAQSAPDMPGQMTPRVRHFADDVLIGLNTKGLFKSKVKEMVSQGKTLKAFAIRASAVGGDRPNTAPEKGSRESRLSRVDTFTDQLRAQLGVEQQISAVGLGETVKVKAPAVKKPK